MNNKSASFEAQQAIEGILDAYYSKIDANKSYAFMEALAIAKELAQENSSSGYIGEKIRHISQCAGLQFFDRENGKVQKWRSEF